MLAQAVMGRSDALYKSVPFARIGVIRRSAKLFNFYAKWARSQIKQKKTAV
jgi:hypothetical protein